MNRILARIKLSSSENEISQIFNDIIQKNGNDENTIAQINNFIDDIVEAYDSNLIDDEKALELLEEFDTNLNINIFNEIDEQEKVASIQTLTKKLKDFFLEEKINDRMEIVVPSVCRYEMPTKQGIEVVQLNFSKIEDNPIKVRENPKAIAKARELKQQRELYIHKIESNFSAWLGGFSYTLDVASGGGWVDDETHQIVIEKNMRIFSDCSKKNATKYYEELKKIAVEMKNALGQDCIYMKVHNNTQYIDE